MYIQSDTVLLSDVFENFRNICLEIYEDDLAKKVSAPELACQASFKKTKVKFDLLTDIDKLLMVEEGIRGGIFTLFMDMQKPTPKKMKDYETNTELLYIQYCNVNNFYVWECPKSFQ